jgi:hypothetical protein
VRRFHLSDHDLAALAAGRPSPGTLAELRRAQLSRHLLLLSEILRAETPQWYAASPSRPILADPATGLYAATAVSMMRSGRRPPDRPRLVTPSPVVTVTCDGLTLRVRLDDADPLRDRLGLTPTGRLTPADVTRWEDQLAQAWQLLVRHHRPGAEILAEVLRLIVPVEPDPAADAVSATSAHAYGAVAMSAPADPVSLAVGLVHETAHSLLNGTSLLFDLVHPSGALGYSPWRDDPRPPSGVLHGAYAYLAVTRFWRAEAARGGGRRAEFEFARWRAAVAAATESLLATPRTDRSGDESGPAREAGGMSAYGSDGVLTAAGRRFVRAMREEVDGWLGEPVDAQVARLADGANLDHRVRWRLRNLRVDEASTRQLADAWRHGRPAPELPGPEVVAGVRRLAVGGRLELVHAWLRGERAGADPIARNGARGDPAARAGGGVRPGDVAWLGGECGTGRDAYLRALEDAGGPAPESVIDDALAGLALVAPQRALRERPEAVRAVWWALGRRPGIPALAEWLSGR